MDILLNVVGPVFTIVALGALTGRRLGFDPAGLARLAYWILGPAFAYDALAGAEIATGVVARLAAAGLGGMVVAGLFALVVMRASRANYERTSAAVMLGAYGNVGNAGLAMAVFALGEEIRPVATVLMLVINLPGMALGIALATARTESIVRALFRAAAAPMTSAGLLALAVNVIGSATNTDIGLPVMFERAVSLVGDALIPVMLYTLGIQLVSAGIPRLNIDLSVSMIAKLVIAPLGAAAIAALVGLTGDNFDAAVIQSAMPPAVFCLVVAMEHDLEPERVTAGVVVTTLAALISLPIVLALI